MKRSSLVFAGLCTLGVLSATPAFASSAPPAVATHIGGETCVNNSDTGTPCLNTYQDNKNNGATIRVWQTGTTLDNQWTYDPLTNMCGSGKVTSTCPFTVGSGLNTQFLGDRIIKIISYYGKCLASSSGGAAVEGNCPDLFGTGGDIGTIQVLDEQNGSINCFTSYYCYVVNRYWSNYHLTAQQVCTSGFLNGSSIYLDYAYGNCGTNYGAWFDF
jgi:hypothetical protein